MDQKTKDYVTSLSKKEGFSPPSDDEIRDIISKYRKLVDISLFVTSVDEAKEVLSMSLSSQGFENEYVLEYIRKFEVFIYIYFTKIDIETLSDRVKTFEGNGELSPVVSSMIEMMPPPESISYDDNIRLFYEFIDYIRGSNNLIVFINNPFSFIAKNEVNEAHKNAISTLMKL